MSKFWKKFGRFADILSVSFIFGSLSTSQSFTIIALEVFYIMLNTLLEIPWYAVIPGVVGIYALYRHVVVSYKRDLIYNQLMQNNQIVEYNGKPLQLSKQIDIEDSHLTGKRFKIRDLLKDKSTIKNRKFEGCHIYGPAIIWCAGKVHFSDPIFEVRDKNTEMVLLDVNRRKGTKIFSGAIGLSDCSFINCRFINIGILGSTKALDALRGIRKS